MYLSKMSANIMEKVKFCWSKTNRWHRGFLIFLLVELRVIPGGQIGFTCNDPALSHPFTGDTISWKVLLATTVFLPLAFMLIVEKIYNKQTPQARQQAISWYQEYLFGLLINLIVTQTLKLIVGSPRPHFFDSCSPKEAETCQGSEYVSSYKCTKAHWISQSNKSFPSGHTSLAIYAAVFLAYYLHKRATAPCAKRIRVVQLSCVVTAAICAVSRMTDHRHHWWDVLAGALLATPIAYYTIQFLCNNFHCPNAVVECSTDSKETEVLIEAKET